MTTLTKKEVIGCNAYEQATFVLCGIKSSAYVTCESGLVLMVLKRNDTLQVFKQTEKTDQFIGGDEVFISEMTPSQMSDFAMNN